MPNIVQRSFITLFVMLVSFVPVFVFVGSLDSPYLSVYLEDVSEGELKVFFDTGSGFIELSSDSKELKAYDKQQVDFQLPMNVRNVRIDPTIRGAGITVRKITMGYVRWPFAVNLDLSTMEIIHQMEIDSTCMSGVRFNVLERMDPYCCFPISEDSLKSIAGQKKIIAVILSVLALVLGLSCGIISSNSIK